MAFSKIILNGVTLMDLTSDTVDVDKLLQTYTAHKADGTLIVGEATAGSSLPLNNPSLWINNDVFSESSNIGSTYENVMHTSNNTGNRIVLLNPYKISSQKYLIKGNTGYAIAVCGFDEDELYLGKNDGGYPLSWTNFTTGTGIIMETTADYIGVVLRKVNTSQQLLPSEIEDVGLSIVDIGNLSLQAKTNISPTTSSQTILPDSGYDGLSSVQINAMPSGSATTPATSITANPTISVNTTTGLITATASTSQSVTPTVSAGYVSSGTAGTVSVSGSNTSQLSTQAGTTIAPTESEQTAVAANKYTLGAVKIGAISSTYVGSGIDQNDSDDLTVSGATVTAPAGYYSSSASKTVASGTAGTPTATKGTVSNHQISVTPSVTNTTGYITGGTKTGTAVTVTASELASGNKAISSNGTNIDVVGYSTVSVDVQPSLQSKTGINPTTSSQTISPDSGYYGLSSVQINAMPTMTLPTSASSSATSGYTSKATIGRSTSAQYINIPTGYNSAGAYYTISATPNGTVTAPSTISGTSATVSTGTNTLTLTKTISVTPNVTTAGYISSGTAGNSSVSLTASINTRSSSDLTVSGDTVTVPAGYYGSQASKAVSSMTLPTSATTSATSGFTSKATISRSTSDQYINIPTGYNSAGAYYKINAVANGTEGTPTATKGTVSNHSISVTPSVTNTAGYISGGTKTGTAVTVNASELASGNKAIVENGTGIDVVGYSTVSVSVPNIENTLVVTLSYNSSTSKWESDKTYAQILAAFDTEKTIVVNCADSPATVVADGYYVASNDTFVYWVRELRNDGVTDNIHEREYVFSQTGLTLESSALYCNTHGATLNNSNQMLQGVSAYSHGTMYVGNIPNITLPSTTSSTSSGTSKATIISGTTAQYLNIPAGYNSTAQYYTISASSGESSMKMEDLEGVPSSTTSISFTGLNGEPTSFYFMVDTSVATGTPGKVVAVVFDGTTLHAQTITNTSNAQVTYDTTSLSKTYSNGTLTITSSNLSFVSDYYYGGYTYDGNDIYTKDVQVGSGATSITFTGLEDEPVYWSCIFKSNFGTSSGYQRVVYVAKTSTGISGIEMDSGSHNAVHWTASYNNGSLTITSQGTNTGGYFHQPGYYQLTYAIDDGSSGGGSSELNLQAKTNINPTTSSQTITADSGYDGLSSVQINAMPTMTLPSSASSTSSGTSKATISRSTSNQYINIPTGYNSTAQYYTISATANMTLPTGASSTSSGTAKATITPGSTTQYLNIPTGYNGTAQYYTISAASGGSSKNAQISQTVGRATSSTYTAVGPSITVSKTGTYDVYWTGYRSSTSGTSGSQLYIGSNAYGTANTTFNTGNGLTNIQTVHLSNVSLTANQVLTIRARSRGNNYYMYIMNLVIIEA